MSEHPAPRVSIGPALRRTGVRLVQLVLALFGASLVVFALVQALPGDLAQVMLGQQASPEQLAQLRAQLGLDRSWIARYLTWLGDLLTGNWGSSPLTGRPIAPSISSGLGITASMVLPGLVLALLIAVPAGLAAALGRNRIVGQVVNVFSQVGMAIPAFVAAMVLVVWFAARWRVLPAGGYVPASQNVVAWALHLVLPVLALGLVQAAMLVRYVRSAFLEVDGSLHITTAAALGHTHASALWRHGWRPVLAQLLDILALQLVSLLVGAIVLERVFVIPGMGSTMLTSVGQRDLVAVQYQVMVVVAIVLVVMALVDVLATWLDPRASRALTAQARTTRASTSTGITTTAGVGPSDDQAGANEQA